MNEPDFQLSDVIAGRYDTYIRNFATAAKAWGHPFFLRFNWEMNGTWFPWSEGVNGNRAGEFVAAWRHVHDIFAEVGREQRRPGSGARTSTTTTTSRKSTADYPGDAYVDWTGLDGYNWGTNPAKPSGWKSFGQLYRSTYRHIVETVAPSKPMMVGEVASSEYGGSKSAWIKNMPAVVPAEYPKIRALLWFDKFDGGMDWPIETSSSATSGFAEGIQNPVYEGSLFSDLGLGAISAPELTPDARRLSPPTGQTSRLGGRGVGRRLRPRRWAVYAQRPHRFGLTGRVVARGSLPRSRRRGRARQREPGLAPRPERRARPGADRRRAPGARRRTAASTGAAPVVPARLPGGGVPAHDRLPPAALRSPSTGARRSART